MIYCINTGVLKPDGQRHLTKKLKLWKNKKYILIVKYIYGDI